MAQQKKFCPLGTKDCVTCRTGRYDMNNVVDLRSALEAADAQMPKLPGLTITVEVQISAEDVNEALSDDSYFGSDPVNEILEDLRSYGTTKVTDVRLIRD